MNYDKKIDWINGMRILQQFLIHMLWNVTMNVKKKETERGFLMKIYIEL